MRFVWKLDCDRVKKVVCAFRSHADPGLQATASAVDPSRSQNTEKSGGGDPLAGPGFSSLWQPVAACGSLWRAVAGDGLPLKE